MTAKHSEILARAIARSLPKTSLHLAEFPAGIPTSFLKAIVDNANGLDWLRDPKVVWIVDGNVRPELPQVHADEAEEYRVGDRVFVFNHREYVPRSSMTSTARRWMSASFPSSEPDLVRFPEIANAMCAVLSEEWTAVRDEREIEGAIERALHALRELSERLGDGETPWVEAWWEAIRIFADRLAAHIPTLLAQAITPVQAVAACASLPAYAISEDTEKRKLATNDIDVLLRRLARTDEREIIEARLNAEGYTAGLLELDLSNVEKSMTAGRHLMTAHMDIGPQLADEDASERDSDLGFTRARAWAKVTAENVRAALRGDTEVAGTSIELDGTPLVRSEAGLHIVPGAILRWVETGTNWTANVGISVLIECGVALPSAAGTLNGRMSPRRISSIEHVLDWRSDSRELRIDGQLSFRISSSSTWLEKAAVLTVDVPPQLRVEFGRSIELELLLGAPIGPTVAVLDEKANLIRALTLTSSPVAADGTPRRVAIKRPILRATVLILLPSPEHVGSDYFVHNRAIPFVSDALRRLENVDVAGGSELLIAESSGEPRVALEFQLEERSLKTEWLPISAAFKGEPADRNPAVSNALLGDLRGEFETHLQESIVGWSGTQSLPLHAWVLLGEDQQLARRVNPDANGVSWIGRPGGAIDISAEALSQLRNSEEFANFCASFYALIGAIETIEDQVSRRFWCSRWSIGRVEKEVVDDYLRTWTALLARSKGKERLWAHFPFSILIADGGGRLNGALLSPLHPIRLAWLWSVERSLRSIRGAGAAAYPRLLQLVEGWNFPAIVGDFSRGPNLAHFVATPLWMGAGNEFLGWSAVAEAGMTAVQLPKRASGRTIPSGGSSGLTSGAVSGAVRDYLRVHPHLSSISLELHAANTVARSQELDNAVINEIAEYSQYRADGRRLEFLVVLDSLNRENAMPRATDVLSKVQAQTGQAARRFVWQRSRSDAMSEVMPDIRFVEDANVTVWVGPHEFPAGATGRVPLRRALVRDRADEGYLKLHIGLTSTGWTEFELALGSVETCNGQPAVLVLQTTANGVGTDVARARWIVTGGALNDPVALSGVLQEEQLLWEWRPASVAKGNSDEALSGRPYLTVARVPDSLVQSLLLFEGVGTRARAVRLLAELGRKGVGLASLVGAGGHHADGALGFFFGFRLLDRCLRNNDSDDCISLVLPLDAVYPMLEAVAQRSEVELGNRRADLLVLRIERIDSRARLTLMPVEIRCSNMRSHAAGASFPGISALEVRLKVEQIEATYRLLSAVKNRLDSESVLSSFASTALIALVEAATAMVDRALPVSLQAFALRALGIGDCEIEVASGVLFWFQKDQSVDGLFLGESDGHAVVMINPVTSSRDLWADDADSASSAVCATIESQLSRAGSRSRSRAESTEANMKAITKSESLRGGATAIHDASDGTDAVSSQPRVDSIHNPPETASPIISGAKVDDSSPTQSIEPATPSRQQASKTIANGDEADSAPIGVVNTGGTLSTSLSGGRDFTRSPQAYLGTQRPAGRVYWDPFNSDRPLNNAHIVIVGAAGAGKTQAIKAIMSDVTAHGVPVLVLDFKDDYSDSSILDACKAKLWNVRKGLPFNPLAAPSVEVPFMDVLYGLKGILSSVYRLGDQQAATLKEALEASYRARGFNSRVISTADAPTLDDLQAMLRSMGGTQLILNRLGPLFDFDLFRPDAAGLSELLSGPAVVNFTSLPQEELKSATAALLLRALYLHLQRIGHSAGRLRLLLVIDEAHRVANLDEVKLLVKEARAYGVGVVLATQEASDLDDFAFSNAGTLISLKLSASSQADRVARMLAGSQEEVGALADTLRSLPMFEAIIRNDQYAPNRRVAIHPFYRRNQ